MHASNETVPWRIWVAVIALGVSTFTIVTTELAPIGILSQLADSFQKSEATTGLVVSVYAWLAAAVALVSVFLFGRFPRKGLLVALMTILAVSNVVAAFAPDFSSLMGARMAGAIAHGAFWAIIGTVGAQLVPARYVGVATSIIFGGVSVASVIGVPITNALAREYVWDTAFLAIAALAVVSMIAIGIFLPKLPAPVPLQSGALREVLKEKLFIRIYGATACAITAHFAAFTYIEPLLSTSIEVTGQTLSILLFTFGAAGILGNIITGKLIDRYLKALISIALLAMSIGVLGLALSNKEASVYLIGALLIVWGAGVAIVFVGFQTWILKQAGPMALPASAIYVAIFNAAIGAGAFIGSSILGITTLSGLMICVAIALALSLVPVLTLKQPTN
ncbi:MFS transporter [Alcaligenes aquatilis]|uniref:MFS transporter n=1 Tax=Alcaligenes aquatilis TaxID=323284 RepID=A0A3G2HQY4_9BURK|nr:MFS transporter [Alcaligenes aquatilis]AYN19536.1 MFS transporter [Alcaligenes aquatilis]